jgi:mono/diheme cytochrome c family protein
MRSTLIIGLLCAAVPAAAGAQSLEHGKYLVERVGMCGDCHTPRDATGQTIAAQALQGAPLGFRPMHPMPFAEQAPSIAGLPAHYAPAQVATFLETGKRPDGSTAKPPMPPYRMSKTDAWSVVRYLQSLKPPS